MRALEIENEDNAVVCLRIIIELHKNYRSSTASAPSSLEVQVRQRPCDLKSSAFQEAHAN